MVKILVTSFMSQRIIHHDVLDISKFQIICNAFYDKLSMAHNTEMGLVSMKVLWTLYQSLGGDSATRYHVYYYLVSIANKTG